MDIIRTWEFGYVAIIGAVSFPFLYLIIRQFKRFGAWANREDGPKERKIVYIPFWAILGFVVGGFLQQFVDIVVFCNSSGQFNVQCIISNM